MSVKVQIEQHGGVPVALITGEVDIGNVGDVSNQLLAAVPNSAPGLIVDLSGTTYLDSRGVHLLLELAERLRRHQQALRIAVPEASVLRRVLMLTHLDSVVPLHVTVDEALAQMESST